MVLLTLAACSGGGGGGGGGTPSSTTSVPPVADSGASSGSSGGASSGSTGGASAGTGTAGAGGASGTTASPPPPPPPAVSGTASNRYATVGSDSPNRLGRLHVFGDSYSDINSSVRTCGNPNAYEHCIPRGQVWSERLVGSAPGATLSSYARDAASARDGGIYQPNDNDFKSQVDRWSGGPDLGANDLTIVYLGYNDINARPADQLAPSIRDYATQVDRLIAGGATASERRLFLTLVHDFGSTPHDPGRAKTARTTTMNNGIAGVVSGKANVVAVDMFTVFNRIMANPARYGLTNVTDVPGAGVDSRTYLHADDRHFSARGQELVAQVYNHYLTRGWDLANSLQGSAANRNQLNNDVDNRLARLALVEGGALGFSSFFVGDERAAGMGGYDAEMGEPSRSGFAQLSRGGRPDTGVGLDYALDAETRLGLVMSRYGSDRRYDLAGTATRLDTESDAVSLYLDTKAGPFDLRSRASYAADRHTKATFDDVVGEGNAATHGGRTVEISQTASTNLRVGRAWLQPWLNVTHNEQQIDGYTISNPLVSDLTYSGGKVTDTLASLGLAATSDAFELGANRRLTLSGGLSYTRSLRADDYEVTIEEAALPGLAQTERVERDGANVIGLRLGSALAMGDSLSLSTDYALTKQLGVEADHALTARFNYRF